MSRWTALVLLADVELSLCVKHTCVKSSPAESEVRPCDDKHIFVLWRQTCWQSESAPGYPEDPLRQQILWEAHSED